MFFGGFFSNMFTKIFLYDHLIFWLHEDVFMAGCFLSSIIHKT